jgi:hypothetical protein
MDIQGQLVPRIMGVLRLDSNTFEEIEADQQGGTTQALIIVVLVAIASGIGLLLVDTDEAAAGLIGGLIASIVRWAVIAALIAWVGTRLLEAATTSSNWGEVARVTGFAQAPAFLGILAFIPVLGVIASIVGGIWSLIATVIGVRQALDMSTGRAIVVCIVAWVIGAIISVILLAIVGVDPTAT